MQTNQKAGKQRLPMDPYFYVTFYVTIISLFYFSCQDANIIGSNCAIIGFNLSHRLALCHQINTRAKTWGQNPNTIEKSSWLVHVLCDFKSKFNSIVKY